MLRNSMIVMLAVAAIGTWALWALSVFENGLALSAESNRWAIMVELAHHHVNIDIFTAPDDAEPQRSEILGFQSMIRHYKTYRALERSLPDQKRTEILRFTGFYCNRTRMGPGFPMLILGCPLWAPVLLFAAYPIPPLSS